MDISTDQAMITFCQGIAADYRNRTKARNWRGGFIFEEGYIKSTPIESEVRRNIQHSFQGTFLRLKKSDSRMKKFFSVG
jgi:hypothetical protein